MCKKFAPICQVGKIQRNALQPAARLLVRKNLFFVSDNLWKIYFDPLESIGQVHAIRPGIKSGSQVKDQICSVFDCPDNKLIEEIGARHPSPLLLVAAGKGVRDLESMLAGQPFGVGVSEKHGFQIDRK